MRDEHAAFYLSLVLCIMETVKEGEKKGGLRQRKLNDCISRVSDMVDLYRPEAWPYEMLVRAE